MSLLMVRFMCYPLYLKNKSMSDFWNTKSIWKSIEIIIDATGHLPETFGMKVIITLRW